MLILCVNIWTEVSLSGIATIPAAVLRMFSKSDRVSTDLKMKEIHYLMNKCKRSFDNCIFMFFPLSFIRMGSFIRITVDVLTITLIATYSIPQPDGTRGY